VSESGRARSEVHVALVARREELRVALVAEDLASLERRLLALQILTAVGALKAVHVNQHAEHDLIRSEIGKRSDEDSQQVPRR